MSGKESDGLKGLVEAVILQAFDDLWSKTNRKQSIEFFTREGFALCLKASDMGAREQILLRRMVGKVMKSLGGVTARAA
ncbi:MAG: hypothetical protein FIA94_11690 [Nitrospirae bacterium]|nr:hypothetical protein [Nitrospirota bacterium]